MKAIQTTQHDFWLLTGNYITLKELPSVEEDLLTNVKADLAIQRLLARPNFRGIVANNPVIVVGFLRNVGAILGEIRVILKRVKLQQKMEEKIGE